MKTLSTEQHDELAEYLQRMQKPLGHHSWWYTNRSSDDCVNVKMHCWPDTEKVMALLTDKERQAVDLLHIDVGQYCDDQKWLVVEQANDMLLEDLQQADELQHKDFRVHALDYGGRSGGWLCVVFDFDGLEDWLEGSEYVVGLIKDGTITKAEARKWEKQALAASEYIEAVHAHVRKMHKDLCNYLEQPEDYAAALRAYIADCIDSEAATIENKAENLRKLAQA